MNSGNSKCSHNFLELCVNSTNPGTSEILEISVAKLHMGDADGQEWPCHLYLFFSSTGQFVLGRCHKKDKLMKIKMNSHNHGSFKIYPSFTAIVPIKSTLRIFILVVLTLCKHQCNADTFLHSERTSSDIPAFLFICLHVFLH